MTNAATPTEQLDRLMRRAGHNPNSLARATGGAVSPTTIRAYLAGGKVTRSKLLAIAKAFTDDDIAPTDVAAMLRAFNLEDLADALEQRAAGATAADVRIPDRTERPLSSEAQSLMAALSTWLQYMEDHIQ